MKPNTHIVDVIQRRLRVLTVATVVVYALVLGAAGYGYYEADQVHHGVCTLREDMERRVESSKEFLARHPQGVAGIDRATLLQSIDNQERTIAALESVNC